jgi:IS30 family transposase
MSQPNIIMKQGSFKQLTERERYQIEILLKEKRTPKEIAKTLGKHTRTIEREIARGKVTLLTSELTYKESYCADAGQRVHERNAANKGAGLKISNDHELVRHIETKIIKDKYAPDAIIGEIRCKGIEFKVSICTKTLYNYIGKGVFPNITNKDLPVKRDKKKVRHKRVKIAKHNLKGSSIEDRPAHIENREEYGHWEMDCVVGKKGGSGATLLVMTERCTRQEIIRKMPDRTQESVKKVLDQLERKHSKNFSARFKTITVDNGTEFLSCEELERSIWEPQKTRFKMYYAHPYSSWERGSNENANKIIRRFIPKGTDIGKLAPKDIRRIEYWMNNYPRKILGYKTAKEMAA